MGTHLSFESTQLTPTPTSSTDTSSNANGDGEIVDKLANALTNTSSIGNGTNGVSTISPSPVLDSPENELNTGDLVSVGLLDGLEKESHNFEPNDIRTNINAKTPPDGHPQVPLAVPSKG